MLLLSAIATLALHGALCLARPAAAKTQNDCAPVHIMSARGSNQPPGEGPTLAPLVDAIVADHPGSTREPIVWPAVIFPYAESSHNGTLAVTAQLTAYVERCPKSKIVLLGFSQGSHVIGDSLCGGGGLLGIGPITDPISTTIGDHVSAIVWLGDPRHRGNDTYNRGTSVRDGIFPRLQSQSCEHYAANLQSYCDTRDIFCDSGDSLQVHRGYIPKYLEAAKQFVNERLR
ncbi:uncharacterized protein CIMG_00526 [Coccidioides immitis RS]|uniref:Acetylxylan esterase n=4 Tax=Coccidioides immitis TaxID=5501 RepID=J3KH70_COCIM|nr:uncharacterized protein CIMG_00526 [Coccidioides immitis RS]EAS35172.3 hypothetical protein CIMG_00526 [Coccidioides immitis RS]KMP00396.1 hypothetical protein CIRG_00538 [Coccidioides immitis RMSCC 2394]KMU76793.1 hypothetical protein CISG_05626 [Coccidioides immitis RMSCC 3703]KMU84587.1 hypothetical protein CIHG_02371 [Coccidioides immitis H538.4]